MQPELEELARHLRSARSSDQVFGLIQGPPKDQLKQGTRAYHHLAKVAHPDGYTDREDHVLAQHTFQMLHSWWQEAQAQILAGTYGATPDPTEPVDVTIQVGRNKYTVGKPIARGELCVLSLCSFGEPDPRQALFKVAIDPRDNDLVANEAVVLRALRDNKDWARFHVYVPQVLDSFLYADASSIVRHVNVLSYAAGFYSLKEVRDVYPNGVDPQDMAWMFRRLLVSLGLAHENNLVHGAVLPDHVLIHPEEHGLVLVDWTCAVRFDDSCSKRPSIQALSLAYEPWYPPEVSSLSPARPGTDIYMAAQCMIYLLGGNPITREMPERVPRRLQMFFQGCLLPGLQNRPQHAWDLLKEFDALLQQLWGKRTFRPFRMKTP